MRAALAQINDPISSGDHLPAPNDDGERWPPDRHARSRLGAEPLHQPDRDPNSVAVRSPGATRRDAGAGAGATIQSGRTFWKNRVIVVIRRITAPRVVSLT